MSVQAEMDELRQEVSEAREAQYSAVTVWEAQLSADLEYTKKSFTVLLTLSKRRCDRVLMRSFVAKSTRAMFLRVRLIAL